MLNTSLKTYVGNGVGKSDYNFIVKNHNNLLNGVNQQFQYIVDGHSKSTLKSDI